MDGILNAEGKRYISSKRATEISGYSMDYIGQLSRAKLLESKMVGQNRLINLDSLVTYVNSPISKKQNIDHEHRHVLENLKSESEVENTFLPKLNKRVDVIKASAVQSGQESYFDFSKTSLVATLVVTGFLASTISVLSFPNDALAFLKKYSADSVKVISSASEKFARGGVSAAGVINTADNLQKKSAEIFDTGAQASFGILANTLSAFSQEPLETDSPTFISELKKTKQISMFSTFVQVKDSFSDSLSNGFILAKLHSEEGLKYNSTAALSSIYGAYDSYLSWWQGLITDYLAMGARIHGFSEVSLNYLYDLPTALLIKGGFVAEESAQKSGEALALLSDASKDFSKSFTASVSGGSDAVALGISEFSARFYDNVNDFFNIKKKLQIWLALKDSENVAGDNTENAGNIDRRINTEDEKPVPSDTRPIIVEGPRTIIENIKERIVVGEGVSAELLSARLSELNNKLSSEIYKVSSSGSAAVSNVYHAVALTNKIDSLKGVDIDNSTITNSTITTSSFSGTSGTFTGNVTAGDFATAGQITVTGTATSTFPTLSVTGRFYGANGNAGLNGYVLQSTGTGANWVATSTLGISGGSSTFIALSDTDQSVFTAGRIIHTNSGGTGLTDTAGFVFNGTNLGIGTTSPYAKLSVVGSSGVVAAKFHATSTTATSTFAGGLSAGNSGLTVYRTGNAGIGTLPISDYSLSLAGTTANDHSRIIDITQANDSAEDSTVLNIVNTANNGTLSTGTRNIKNSYSSLTPTVTVRNTSGTFTNYNAYASDNLLSLANLTLSTSLDNFPITLNTYANNATISGDPTIGTSDATFNIGGYNADLSSALVISSGQSSSFNIYGGRFANAVGATPPGVGSTLNSYGILASATGNLGTDSTTAHYGGYFTVSGTADTNYGLWVDSSGGVTNSYGIYINSPSSNSTNYALYSSATAQSYFAGNVGIGTTSPYVALSVVGSSGVVAAKFHATSTTATSTFAGGVIGPSNFVIQQNSGRVGIGDTTPESKLDVEDTSSTTNTDRTAFSLTYTDTGTGGSVSNLTKIGIDSSLAWSGNYTSGGQENIITKGLNVSNTYSGTFNGADDDLFRMYGSYTSSSFSGSIGTVGSPTIARVYGSYATSGGDLGTTATTEHYGGYFTVSGTADTNYGLWVDASGATNNYAAVFSTGNVGIGDATPNSLFTVGSGDLFQINSTGQIGSQQAPVSDYLFALAGSATNDYSRIIDITQANDVSEDSSVINIVNTVNTGTLSALTTRNIKNQYLSLTPTGTVSSATGGTRTLNIYGLDQAINLSNTTLGDTTSSTAGVITYGNNVSITGTPVINNANADADQASHTVSGTNNTITLTPTLTAASDVRGNYYGTYNSVSITSSGNAGYIPAVYGSYNEASGNLTTTGSTNHYAGYFTASGTADNNYGIYVTSSSATNNYGIYIVGPSSGATNYALYSGATAQSYFAGSVGIASTSPWRALGVVGTVGFSSTLSSESGNDNYLCIDPTTYEVTNGGADCGASSERYKENIEAISYGLEEVLKLEAVSYDFKDTKKRGLGFIAEKVVNIVPDVVEIRDGIPESINYKGFVPIFAQAIQEMWEKVQDTIARVTGLEDKVSTLEARIAALENKQSAGDSSENQTQNTTLPTIVIQGDNPSRIETGTSYMDLGAIAKDSVGRELSYKIYVDDVEVTEVSIDTASEATYMVKYEVTDTDGNTASALRVVNVVSPEPEPPASPEPIPESSPEPTPET